VAAAWGSPFGDGLIYTSTNSGATWTQASAPAHFWHSIASSSDGARLIALGSLGEGNSLGESYTSADSGATWTLVNTPAEVNFLGPVAASANGSNFVALAPSHIYTLQFPFPPPPPSPSPRLGIGPSGGSLGLSWLAPSSRFVLQQNSDLTTTNWTDVPTTPTLNFTNLNYQVTAPFSPGSHFYRLEQR